MEDPFEQLNAICERFDNHDELLVSDAYPDGGIDPLFPRLLRAAMNQADQGAAALPRYGTWANTVRDNIREALKQLDGTGVPDEATRLLIRAHNSLSAFAEIQRLLEPEDSPLRD